MRRSARIGIGVVLGLALLVVGAWLVLTRSDFGRNRVRVIALNAIRNSVNGTVEIGRIEGNVLGNFTLVDVRIADSAGNPLLSVERVSATMNSTALLTKRIDVSRLILVKPRIHIFRTPDEGWNYARIFKSGEGGGGDSTVGFGDWVVLRNVTLEDGSLLLQRPWEPEADLRPATRDSVIRAALTGESRARIDRAPYGLRQTIEFRTINARLPGAVVADPAHTDIVLRFDSLAMLAQPFNPPPMHVRQFAGEVRIGRDTVTAADFTLNLPDTRTKGAFTYVLATGDMFGTIRADTLAFTDIRALYPPLPDSGGGRLDITMAVRDTGANEYTVTNADLRVGTAQLGGRLGLVITDTISAFRDTDLDFARFPTALIEHFIPAARAPVPGHLTGRVKVAGDIDALRLDGALMFDPLQHAPFRIVARGGLGFAEGFTTNRLFVSADRMPVSVVHEFGLDPRIGGTLTGNATLSGSTATRFRGPYRLVHNERGTRSHVEGEGSIAVRDNMRMDISMRFLPVSLELAEHFVKETDIRGAVTGTGRIQGTPRDLAAKLDLHLPDTGTVQIDGTYRLPNDNVAAYTATVTMRDVDVQRIIPSFPATSLQGVTTLDGRGTRLATVDARVSANLQMLMVDSAEFRDVTLTASARDGLLTVDTLHAGAAFGSASVAGTFGLVAGKDGTLRYRAEVTDLGGLTRWIATGDTGLVAARPGFGVRLARARQVADSIRRAFEAQKGPAAQLAADLRKPEARPTARQAPNIQPIPRDSIGGSFSATGDAQGNVKRFDVNANARTAGLVWGGHLVGAGSVKGRWTDAGTPNNSIVAEGGVDSLRVTGFAFDSTRFKGRYARGAGDIELAVYPGDTAEYRVNAAYVLHAGEGEVHLNDIRLRFDSTAWASTRASTIKWRGQGLTIDSLELRNNAGRGGARIFVNGEIPDCDPGRIEVAIDSLRLAPWITLLQSDVIADGIATFSGVMTGTRASPTITATLVIGDPSYKGVAFPGIHSRMEYANRTLTLDSHMRRAAGSDLARVTGTLPIDLSLGDSVKTRLLDSPIALTIEGDSIPLSPLAEFTDAVTSVNGRAFGRIEVAGTWKSPRMTGGVGIDAPSVGIAAVGVIVSSVKGRLRVTGDTLVIDSLAGYSQGPVKARGTIVLAELDNPVLNVAFEASRARVLGDERGRLTADANLRATGPINSMVVSGSLLIRNGVIYIPDPEKLDVINTADPAIFAVVDTATARGLDVAPPSEFRKNLRLNVTVEARRSVFARSADANVEVYGNLALRMDPSTNGELAVTGSLYTDHGFYTFLGKRFDVTRGSARFTGEADPNPILQILATHEVRQAGRAPLDIRVILGGTLKQPTVSLESDAQPKLSQSDLIAFLAFGQSSSGLLQFTGTGLEGGGQGGSSLAGNVAALAQRQLASVAVGALVDEAKRDLTSATQADVLNITPAELPTDISLGAFQTVLKGTELEIGKYTGRNTFVLGRVRTSLAIPGALVERRVGRKIMLRGSFETRFLPERPTLTSGLTPKTIQVIGALMSWKLAW